MIPLNRTYKYIGFLFLLVPIIFIVLIGYMEEQLLPKRLHMPRPLILDPLYPPSLPLFGLDKFKYIINNDVCGSKSVFGIVIIHSHPANRNRRDTMRQSIPQEDLKDLDLRRVFLLARAEWDDQDLYKRTPQDSINEENTLHGDIIQGNFKEHYHNLTYKHVMGLQWATRMCSQANFIIKMDDDIIVDLYQFRDRLKYRYAHRTNLILGLLQIEAKIVRDPSSKWFVSTKELSQTFYPNFVSGWAYAATMDAARKIVEATKRIPFFWIDDVYLTGIVADKVHVKREGLNRLYTIYSDHLRCCIELPQHANYFCDFYAGPSEGNMIFMEKVLSHARSCYINPCKKRSPEKSIVRTCVTVGDEHLRSLTVGQGEVIKVFR